MDGDGSFDPAELRPLLAGGPERGRATSRWGDADRSVAGVWPWHARLGQRGRASPGCDDRTGFPAHDIAPMRVCRRADLLALDVQDRRFGYPLELLQQGDRRRLADRGARRGLPAAGGRHPLQGHRLAAGDDPHRPRLLAGAAAMRPAVLVVAKAPVARPGEDPPRRGDRAWTRRPGWPPRHCSTPWLPAERRSTELRTSRSTVTCAAPAGGRAAATSWRAGPCTRSAARLRRAAGPARTPTSRRSGPGRCRSGWTRRTLTAADLPRGRRGARRGGDAVLGPGRRTAAGGCSPLSDPRRGRRPGRRADVDDRTPTPTRRARWTPAGHDRPGGPACCATSTPSTDADAVAAALAGSRFARGLARRWRAMTVVDAAVEREPSPTVFARRRCGEPCTVHGLADGPHRLPMHRWAWLRRRRRRRGGARATATARPSTSAAARAG